MIKKKLPLLITILFLLVGLQSKSAIAANALSELVLQWQQTKGKHFIVYNPTNMDTWKARQILNAAEKYYVSIASQIGYARYDQFWTWEERVKIFIFENKKSFVEKTGLPNWSLGGALRDEETFASKAIITYRQEVDFLDGVLPHEICHLILRDYFAPKSPPTWFDEGVAQLNEKNKILWAKKVLPELLSTGKLFQLAILFSTDIGRQSESVDVYAFYAQSISVIDFLLSKFGAKKFSIFTQKLKETGSTQAALRSAYAFAAIDSVETLEKKWLRYINKQ